MDARNHPPTRRLIAPAWCWDEPVDTYETGPSAPSLLSDLAEMCDGLDKE